MKKSNTKKIKFNKIIFQWLNSKRNLKIQSFQKYERIIMLHIGNNLGTIEISSLLKNDIIKFFDELKNKGIALSTQKTILYIIKASLEFAYKNKYCNYIDLKNIKIGKVNKTIYVFSKEQQLLLENILKSNINIRKLCLLLCLYTGLRIGEICGLKWENINFNTNSLEVKRTIQRIKNINKIGPKTILIESTPKSLTSNRIVPIPVFIMEYLKKHRNKNNCFILSNSENLYDPRQFESFYKRILNKCGISYVNFHTLRHTFATRSIESKMDIKTLSEILGHSSVEITLKLYVHPSYELKKISIENLVKFMTN